MPIRRVIRGFPTGFLPEGVLEEDPDAITSCQRACAIRLSVGEQQAQEAYLSEHPEAKAMMEMLVSQVMKTGKRKGTLKTAAEFFTRSSHVLDEEIRKHLGLPPPPPPTYVDNEKEVFKFKDRDLEHDLRELTTAHYPPPPWKIKSPCVVTPDTLSSSFISFVTSDSTVPTPEPVPTPDPTLSEVLSVWVSNTVDKAIYLHVDEGALKYDTAYVELMKSVEQAMEIPVIEIREDIAELLYNSYQMFELDILEKERIAAEIAWGKRMRKKLKRTLRRMKNFKGYETPPTPKSEISSHPSYLKPPQKPCECHPQFHDNRYPKDRFGIYKPRDVVFEKVNITATPVISTANVNDDENEKVETKSIKSTKSSKSAKKTTFVEFE